MVAQEPFVAASRDLLGHKGCYPMIAYGTMQESEAFRNVCRTKEMDYDEINEVAKHINSKNSTKDLGDLTEESQKYIDTIASASVHPCAHLLFDGDIEEEIGVLRIGDAYCAAITSDEADGYKYLKNDYLIVKVLRIISDTFKMANVPMLSVQELLDITRDDPVTWAMYEKGLTSTLNQIDSEYGTSLMLRYKAKTIEEVEMFVASVRPSFNAWRNAYINREPYSTGVKQLDELLSSTNGFILFQENIMQFFGWLGVDAATSIGLIKKISKKKIKPEDFSNLEEQLRAKWIDNTGSERLFTETWADIQNCMAYGFAAPHAYATAIDSLYGAYLKSHYPLEYFTVTLNLYSDSQKKTQRLTDELKYFNIKMIPPRYGYSKDIYSYDAENRIISKGIASIKYLNAESGLLLYELSKEVKCDSFIDLLIENYNRKILDARKLDILIKLNYFSDFGNTTTLLRIVDLFDWLKQGEAKRIPSEEVEKSPMFEIIKKYTSNINKNGTIAKQYTIRDMDNLLHDCCSYIVELKLPERPLRSIIEDQQEYLGYVSYISGKKADRQVVFVSDVIAMQNKQSKETWGYAVFAQSLGTGKATRWTLQASDFKKYPIKKNDIIYVDDYRMKENEKGTWFYLKKYYRVG